MDTSHGIASFVVRFAQQRWRDADGTPHLGWRGRIQHVQGDEESPFTDAAEAIAFMQRHLTRLTLSALPGGSDMEGERLIRESFEIWVNAMEKALEQSAALGKQLDRSVERTLGAWGLPVDDPSGLAEAVSKLGEQIASLNARLDRLERSGRIGAKKGARQEPRS